MQGLNLNLNKFKLMLCSFSLVLLTGCRAGVGTYQLTIGDDEVITISYSSDSFIFNSDDLVFEFDDEEVQLGGYDLDRYDYLVSQLNTNQIISSSEIDGKSTGQEFLFETEDDTYFCILAVDGIESGITLESEKKSLIQDVIENVTFKGKSDITYDDSFFDYDEITGLTDNSGDISKEDYYNQTNETEITEQSEFIEQIEDETAVTTQSDESVSTYSDWEITYSCEYFVDYVKEQEMNVTVHYSVNTIQDFTEYVENKMAYDTYEVLDFGVYDDETIYYYISDYNIYYYFYVTANRAVEICEFLGGELTSSQVEEAVEFAHSLEN